MAGSRNFNHVFLDYTGSVQCENDKIIKETLKKLPPVAAPNDSDLNGEIHIHGVNCKLIQDKLCPILESPLELTTEMPPLAQKPTTKKPNFARQKFIESLSA